MSNSIRNFLVIVSPLLKIMLAILKIPFQIAAGIYNGLLRDLKMGGMNESLMNLKQDDLISTD
jgi:hypothetical protein